MKAFVSWSGGKDCMYALYHFLKNKHHQVVSLVNMCEADGQKSRSHGLSGALIERQALAMGIPVIQQPIEAGSYEQSFKKAIVYLKEQGATAGVFGDIYLQEHRVWIERVCADMGISAVFPLWEMNTSDLIRNFVADGFKTITVSVRKQKLSRDFLGRVIDEKFLNDLGTIPNIDLCGENGEYHTFVFDGPLFSETVSFATGREWEDDKHWFLALEYSD